MLNYTLCRGIIKAISGFRGGGNAISCRDVISAAAGMTSRHVLVFPRRRECYFLMFCHFRDRGNDIPACFGVSAAAEMLFLDALSFPRPRK